MVIGISFHTAPVDIREKLSIPEAQLPQAISELCALNHIEEAAVLSTCNRMEIYVVALSQHRGVKEVTEWMSKVVMIFYKCILDWMFCYPLYKVEIHVILVPWIHLLLVLMFFLELIILVV